MCCAHACIWCSQRTAFRSQFSPFVICIPRVKHRLSDSAASTFAQWPILPAPLKKIFFFIYLFFSDRISHILVCPWTSDPLICSSKCWDPRHEPPYPFYLVLGIQLRISCMLSQPSTNWISCLAPTTVIFEGHYIKYIFPYVIFHLPLCPKNLKTHQHWLRARFKWQVVFRRVLSTNNSGGFWP